MTLLCGQSSNLRGKSNRFYKFCFITNDIQHVSAGTIGGKTDLLAPGHACSWTVIVCHLFLQFNLPCGLMPCGLMPCGLVITPDSCHVQSIKLHLLGVYCP